MERLCAEKKSELPQGDPGRDLKCRGVLQGNGVISQNKRGPCVHVTGSSPAAMEACDAVGPYGSLSGNEAEQTDA